MKLYVLTFTIMALLLASCGQKAEQAAPTTTADFLPATIAGTDIERSSEPKTFVGEALYEHIDGGAEVYHTYDFADVATAYYRRGETELLADVYRFATDVNAFGLYSTLRPFEPSPLPLGVEGFAAAGIVTFVKGQYVVKLTGYDENAETTEMMRDLAQAIAQRLPGTTRIPAEFSKFPAENRVSRSEKIISESYLGQQALTDIYTCNYVLDDDTVTLFLTDDADGVKYEAWLKKAGEHESPEVDSFALPFKDGQVIAVDNPYYGLIIGGPYHTYLAGAVGYGKSHQRFVTDWLAGLR